MFKKILKIVGIVLAVTVVGVGILAGVLALQGKFKDPYQEPDSIYFVDGEMHVTYYAKNNVVLRSDSNFDIEDKSLINVNYFELKGTPDNITELNCSMTVKSGSELIEFCDENGVSMNRSRVKIGEKVYFKIKDSFDDSENDVKLDNYKNTHGKVELSFITENQLCKADLVILIDRQTSQVSLYDFNDSSNNTHTGGVFDFEKKNTSYVKVATPKQENIQNYYTYADGIYLKCGADDEIEDGVNYYIQEIDKTLRITVEANSNYQLLPIFAPNASNEPYFDGVPKNCDIFVNYGDEFYNIYETALDFIKVVDGKYYFNAEQAGDYEFYVVAYPTYALQEKFNSEFESDNLSDQIFNNLYAVSRKVVFSVENSGIVEVLFNNGDVVNASLDLFEYNTIAVNNSKTSAIDLGVSMYNNLYEKVYSRYNQLEFWGDNHFELGNIKFKNGARTISIGKNSTSATLSGFDNEYNGSYEYTLSYADGIVELAIQLGAEEDYALKIPCAINSDLVRVLNDANISDTNGDKWIVSNDVLLIKKLKSDKYQIGTAKTGSYLVMMQNNDVVNDKFEFVSSGFGVNKTFSVLPVENINEVSLYCFVINDDGSMVYTSQPAGVQIVYQDTQLSQIYPDVQKLKIKLNGASQSYDVGDIVRFVSGTYKYPLMFVKEAGAKVQTIPQITFKYGNERYVLVGYMKDGNFKNEILPLKNSIGEQDVYVLTLKYSFNKVKNANDLVLSLLDGMSSNDENTPNFYEKVALYDKPNDFDNYYYLNDGAILQCSKGDDWNGSTTYLVKRKYAGVGMYIQNNEHVGVISDIGYAKNGDADVLNISATAQTLSEDDEEREFVVQTDVFKSLRDGEYLEFNNSPIVTLNLVYAEVFDKDDTDKQSIEFDISVVVKDGDDEKTDEQIKIKEDTSGLNINEGVDSYDIYSAITVNNASLLKLIACADEDTNVLGLNKYFVLGMRMYNKDGAIVSSGIVEKTGESYTISQADINGYFRIDKISYSATDNGGGGCILVVFSTKSDPKDTFEGYTFRFYFVYDELECESNDVEIESTAVKGYQFKVDDETYSFANHKLRYTVDYQDDAYVMSGALVSTDGQEIILGYAVSGFRDNSLLENNGKNGTYITTSDGVDNNEFSFSILSNDESVISIDDNMLIIHKCGDVKIRLTNTTKSSVYSEFDVSVVSNMKLYASENKITTGATVKPLGDVFEYRGGDEGAIDVFNEEGLVKFIISNVEPSEYKVSDDGMCIVDKTNNNAVVITLEYNTENSRWQLTRADDYLLSVLTFKLTAYTDFADGVTISVEYTSPVKIEKNANNKMSELDTIPYYLGTNLVLASVSDNDTQSLFKLTNTSGGEESFKLQIYWYKKLTGDSAPTFDTQKYYKKIENGEYVSVEDADKDDFAINHTNYYEKTWIDKSSDMPLTLSLNAVDGFKADDTFDARVFFSEQVKTTFKVVVKDNVFIETKTCESDAVKSENTKSNPQKMSTGSEISLDNILYITQYETSAESKFVVYDNTGKKQITDATYAIKSDDTNSEMFNVEEKMLKLVWVNTTGSNIYTLKLGVTAGGKTYTIDYFVSATSSYNITKTNKTLPSLNAYEEKALAIADYFTIKNGLDNATISSVAIKCFVDEECTQQDNNFSCLEGKLLYSYPYISDNTRYLVFTFNIDGKTLTDNVAYPINIENYKIPLKTSLDLVAGTEYGFNELFDTTGSWEKICKIRIDSNNKQVSLINNEDISNSDTTLKISSKICGADYKYLLQVTIYYTENNCYTYEQEFEVKNPTHAKVSNWMFGDLTVSRNNDWVDVNGIAIEFVEDLHYLPTLTGEKIVNLKDVFKVYNNKDEELIESKYKLKTIELYATLGLSGDVNYKSKLVINADLTISVGDFGRIGYAVFKLCDNEGTSCYYTISVVPQNMGTYEKYTKVLGDDNSSRNTVAIENVPDTNKTIVDVVKANLSSISKVTGLSESYLNNNGQFSVYLLKDEKGYTEKSLYTNVSDVNLREVNNPTTIKVAVLFKNSMNVYICDCEIVIMPNVTVTLQEGTTTLEGYYSYGTSVKYSYADGVSNKYSFNDILTVTKDDVAQTISSVSVVGVSENNIEITKDNLTNNITSNDDIISIDTTQVTLKKNISEQISITLKLTYENGLIVTLVVVYEPYQNSNTTRSYKLGWNGTAFVNSLDSKALIKDYNGAITATLSEGTLTTIGDKYQFELSGEQQTKTLILTLTDIVGTPSYTFTITLSENINSTYKMGETASDPVSTTNSTTGSVLALQGVGGNKLTLSTNSTNGEEIFVLNYAGTISNVSVAFYDLNDNEKTGFVTYDGDEVQFIDSASDISGVLKITTNTGTYPIYVTMLKTYEVTANYRVSTTVDGTTKNKEYETMLIGSTLTYSDFMSTSLQNLTIDNTIVNSSRFNNESKIYGEGVNSVNKASWKLMYQGTNGLVEDSARIYASYDKSKDAFTFKVSGTVYIMLYNNTGLEVLYRLQIQDDDNYVDNVTWNQDNTNTGKTDTTNATYYSTDIATLTSTDGYKLASLNFNPSDISDLTFFRMYVTSYNGCTGTDTGTNSYDANDETKGKFVAGELTLSYEVKNFNIYLKIAGADSITFACFDIVFVTVNGVNNNILLYVTNVEVEKGITTGFEEIYANQEGLSLSTILSNGKKRVTITNGSEITYNNDSGDYKLYYLGATNVTKGIEYARDDKSFVDVSSANDYMTDEFNLKSTAVDNNIQLHYYLAYAGIRVATFSYQFIVKNDIKITVNNFDNTGNNSIGDIYLNNYPCASNAFTVDLINKTDDTYYRNEYIVYKNLRTGQTIFGGGDNGKNVASYMKFELIDSYLGSSSREVFSKDEVSINEKGKLTIKADKSGKIGVKITAQYCPAYSITVILNVHATVDVTRNFTDSEYMLNGTSAHEPLGKVSLVTTNMDKSAYLKLTTTETNETYVVETTNCSASPDIKVNYRILESIGEVGTGTYTSVTYTTEDDTIQVTLPMVPYSTTLSYIVSYQVTITKNGTARIYYCNYSVQNKSGLTVTSSYQDKVITVGEGAQSGTNLTIYAKGETSLFTSNEETPGLLENGYIKFENIVDATGSRNNTGFMNITSSDGKYSINLGTNTIFSNSMTFDIVFYNSTQTTELYRSTGWTMTATDKVTPNNSKALLDIFTEAELGNDLLDKNFVAVISSGKSVSTSWFNNASVGTANFEKTITREARTYTIYSFTASKSGGGNFYDLQGTFYFISGSPTNFIVTDNWYISYVVNDSDKNLTVDIKNNAQVFNGSSFTISDILSITSSDYPSYVSISGTTISITSEDLETLQTNNITSCEFYITISGGSTSRTVKVVITFDFA